jgi:hypothetical protein
MFEATSLLGEVVLGLQIDENHAETRVLHVQYLSIIGRGGNMT